MREEMNRTHWTPGSLVKFDFIYGGCKLNNKLATYLGPEFIHRPDGVIIENHYIKVGRKSQAFLLCDFKDLQNTL